MYILELFSSWGTCRICPTWSPSEHQLTPALSPIWGPRPKPRRLEEVVYSPNDSCSHFTQCLFPPKLPQQRTCTVPYHTFNIIHTYIHHSWTSSYIFFIYMTSSLFHFFGSSWQAGCPSVTYVQYKNRMKASECIHLIVLATVKNKINVPVLILVHVHVFVHVRIYCMSVFMLMFMFI